MIPVITIVLAYIYTTAPTLFHNAVLATTCSRILSALRRNTTSFSTMTTNSTSKMSTTRPPVYFVSHGGPSTMFDTTHPVYPQLQSIGREIRDKVKPRAILVVSAHWQADVSPTTSSSGGGGGGNSGIQRRLAVEINTAAKTDLVYDFYGFPRHYYATRFPHVGSEKVAASVASALRASNVEVLETSRGLDHGVFVPFKIMFDSAGQEGGLLGPDVPVVQMSLLADETDLEGHLRLGRALEGLRAEGVCVVVSGMSVHNLRDFLGGAGARLGGKRDGMGGYAEGFDEALRDAVEAEPGVVRDRKMAMLGQRADCRRAHPSLEHLVPIHVGVGAAGGDRGERLWTLTEAGSVAWAQFRFGEVEG
jgi:4,5-DOPA dioxygenase extradiol